MAELNPRKLAIMLEDLQQEFERWGIAADDVIKVAAYQQKQSDERVAQAQRLLGIVVDNTITDRTAIDTAVNTVEVLSSRCVDSGQSSQRTLNEASHALRAAEEALAEWKNQLEQAVAWRGRAEQRVSAAEKALQQALVRLDNAKYEFDHAQRALRSCLNYRDDKGRGRNCSGERVRMYNAEVEARAAAELVVQAKQELEDANAELERAQIRVRCCEQAVGFASSAVQTAQQAMQRAEMAINAAERSLEYAVAARRSGTTAEKLVMAAENAADDMSQEVQLAVNLLMEATHHLRSAEQSEESAQRLRTLARTEFHHRIEQLHIVNRPDLSV